MEKGAEVIVAGYGSGVVCFLGQTSFAGGKWAGISLAEALGDNDGSKAGVRYFTCPQNHGLFVRPNVCRVVTSKGLAPSAPGHSTPLPSSSLREVIAPHMRTTAIKPTTQPKPTVVKKLPSRYEEEPTAWLTTYGEEEDCGLSQEVKVPSRDWEAYSPREVTVRCVFPFLTVRELYQCRSVCWTWYACATAPSLWIPHLLPTSTPASSTSSTLTSSTSASTTSTSPLSTDPFRTFMSQLRSRRGESCWLCWKPFSKRVTFVNAARSLTCSDWPFCEECSERRRANANPKQMKLVEETLQELSTGLVPLPGTPDFHAEWWNLTQLAPVRARCVLAGRALQSACACSDVRDAFEFPRCEGPGQWRLPSCDAVLKLVLTILQPVPYGAALGPIARSAAWRQVSRNPVLPVMYKVYTMSADTKVPLSMGTFTPASLHAMPQGWIVVAFIDATLEKVVNLCQSIVRLVTGRDAVKEAGKPLDRAFSREVRQIRLSAAQQRELRDLWQHLSDRLRHLYVFWASLTGNSI